MLAPEPGRLLVCFFASFSELGVGPSCASDVLVVLGCFRLFVAVCWVLGSYLLCLLLVCSSGSCVPCLLCLLLVRSSGSCVSCRCCLLLSVVVWCRLL